MRAFRSTPGGARVAGGKAIALAVLATWLLLPTVLIPVLIGGGELAGLADAGDDPLGASVYLVAAVQYAMLVSWTGLLAAVPAMLGAMRLGLFGWASAVLIGALAGSLAGLLPVMPAAPFPAIYGAGAILGLWAMLRATRPRAFTAC